MIAPIGLDWDLRPRTPLHPQAENSPQGRPGERTRTPAFQVEEVRECRRLSKFAKE